MLDSQRRVIFLARPARNGDAADGPLLRYLSALESFDRRFPGFRSETHGVTLAPDTGDYLIECVRQIPAQQAARAAGEHLTAPTPNPLGPPLPPG